MKKKPKVKDRLKYEVIGLISLAIGIYSSYSIIADEPGKIGMVIKFILGFLLGQAGIYFTIFLIFVSLTTIIKSKSYKWNRKSTAIIVIGINYSILQYLFKIKETVAGPLDSNIFFIAWENALANAGGGFIGLLLSSLLVSLFSNTGALIVIFFTTIIALVMFTQKPFKVFFKDIWAGLNNGFRSVRQRLGLSITKSDHEALNESVEVESSEDIKKKMDYLDEKIKILDYTQVNTEDLVLQKNEEINPSQNDQKDEFSLSNHPYISNLRISDYRIPPIDLLNKPIGGKTMSNKKKVLNNAKVLERTLADFGIQAKVVQVNMGPTITRYELHPSPGVKVSRIVNLSDDIALNLAATGVRIEAPIPGKAAIGIEVPNQDTSMVYIRELIEDAQYRNFPSNLAFAVGKNILGEVLVTDIASMPHLLIAGATGSGKSVCINSLITSILYKSTPEQVRMVLIDPKVVELSVYNGIPHLLIPVVTDPKKAANALNWAVQEMTERYKKFAECGVRDINRYNEMYQDQPELKMPQILVIIDELADLMMVSPQEVEDAIYRLAQMARAAGIHLIIATQRPSVDVITGVIKANIPSRIAFAVSSHMDSRTILDMGGAEKLLGKGDMLFYPIGETKPLRVQGAFISDKEVEKVVQYIKDKNQSAYDDDIIEEIQVQELENSGAENEDVLLPKAIELAVENQQISISMLQRRLRIGYARAARLIDEMENRKIIGGYEGSKPRKVFISKEE